MWVRLDESKLGNIGLGERGDPRDPNLLAHRVYGLDGKLWPRKTIGIWKDDQGCIKISCEEKRESGKSWWNTANIPPELIEETRHMLQEVAEKIKSVTSDK